MTVHHRHQVIDGKVLRVAEHDHEDEGAVYTSLADDGHYHRLPETEAERKWPPLTSEPLICIDDEEVPG